MSRELVVVQCVHCGEYEASPKDAAWLRSRSIIDGFQCPRCDDECHVVQGGVRVYPGELR